MRTNGRRRRWIRAVAVGSVVLAGCGSGDDDVVGVAGAPSPTVETGADAAGVDGLAGLWQAHGRWIGIEDDGSFEISYRTYRPCSTDPAPCDSITEHEITNGGYVAGAFDEGDGPTWRGAIVESAEPGVWPVGPVEATYDEATRTLDVRPSIPVEEPWIFCAPSTVDARCGA